jgi:hypothetical protein
MEDNKQIKLSAVVEAYERYQECQEMTTEARENFIDKVMDARAAKATQQQIADEVELSRQRIAQFMDERKPVGRP